MKYEAIIALGNNEVIGWWRRTDTMAPPSAIQRERTHCYVWIRTIPFRLVFRLQLIPKNPIFASSTAAPTCQCMPTTNIDDDYYLLLSVFRSRLWHCVFMYSTLIGICTTVAGAHANDELHEPLTSKYLHQFAICYLVFPHEIEMHPTDVPSPIHICRFSRKSVHIQKAVAEDERNRKKRHISNGEQIIFSFSHFNAIFIGCKTHLYSLGSIYLVISKINYHSVSQSVSGNVDDAQPLYSSHSTFTALLRIANNNNNKCRCICWAVQQRSAGTHIEMETWNGLSMAPQQTRRNKYISRASERRSQCELLNSRFSIPDGCPRSVHSCVRMWCVVMWNGRNSVRSQVQIMSAPNNDSHNPKIFLLFYCIMIAVDRYEAYARARTLPFMAF